MIKSAVAHFERLETKEGIINTAKDAFKTFNSLLRIGNLQGIRVTRELFPEEYGSKGLLESNLLQDCKLYANRETGEKTHLQQKSKVLEIGVASGAHAASLIQNLNPATFTGVDIDFGQLKDEHKVVLENHASKGRLQLHQTDSAKFLETKIAQGENYDFIYIDANHWHSFVKRELELSAKLIGVGGHIVLNDYLLWFISSMEPCGVIKATNDFLHDNENWKVEYFAINDRDICLRRLR